MPSVFITGANRGIGLEFVRQYADDGWRVFAVCRDPSRASDLVAIKGDIRIESLDVGDFDAIENLARKLSNEPVDVLINNAGVYGAGPQNLKSLDPEIWMETLRINCMAPIYVSRAFIENVARSAQKIMVAITSKMGSIDDNTSGGAYIYRSSKAALNAAVKSLAIDLAPRGITAAVIHPGWVQTDMGGAGAPTSVEKSVSGMRKVIGRLGLKDAGRFWSYDGKEIPW
jgi:NAD(P)-dependent dehydrogenase (short-subunit alcohol dehydrogenase family)